MTEVPAPLTLAPMAFRQSARSISSGSQAALVIAVSPSARTAASMACSVAPTELNGKSIWPPRNPRGAWA